MNGNLRRRGKAVGSARLPQGKAGKSAPAKTILQALRQRTGKATGPAKAKAEAKTKTKAKAKTAGRRR